MKNFQQKFVDQDINHNKIDVPNVTAYMAKKLITFKPDTKVKEVVDSLLDNHITGAPVLDDYGKVVGLIDDKDCLKILVGALYYNQPGGGDTVADFMSSVMKSISIDDNIAEVANIFLSTPYKRLLVMDHDGKLAGQVSRRDILRAVRELNRHAL